MPEAANAAARVGDLQVVLNAFAEEGRDVVLHYPFYDLDILRYDPSKGEVVSSIDARELGEERARRAPKPDFLRRDLPGWDDVRAALVSSGATEFANAADVRADLARAVENAKDPRNPRPVYLGFDTNVFYHRILRRNLPHEVLPPGNAALQRVASEGVREELETAFAVKYTERDVETLGATLADHRRVRALQNRSIRKGRLAKAGHTDLARMRKDSRVVSAPCPPLPAEAERHDKAIAASYGDFVNANPGELLLLTADQGMAHHALAAGVRPVVLDLPRLDTVPRGFLDERDFCRFVHDLAISFAHLQLGGTEIRLWGEWSGKRPEEWDSETVLLELPTAGKLPGTIERDLTAAKKIEAAFRGSGRA